MPIVPLPQLEVTKPHPVAVIMNDGSTFSSEYLWGAYTSYCVLPRLTGKIMENLDRCFSHDEVQPPTAADIQNYFEILKANQIPRIDKFVKSYYEREWQTWRYTVSHFMHVVTEKHDKYPLIVDVVFKNDLQLLQELLGDSDSVALNKNINFFCRIIDKMKNKKIPLKNCALNCTDTLDYLFALEAIEKDTLSYSLEYIIDHQYWAMAQYVLSRTEFQLHKIAESNVTDGRLFMLWGDHNKTDLTDTSLICFKLLCLQYMKAGVNLLEKINYLERDDEYQFTIKNSLYVLDIALHHSDARVLAEFLNILYHQYTPKEVSDNFDTRIQKLSRDTRSKMIKKFEIANESAKVERSFVYRPVIASASAQAITSNNNNNEVVSTYLPNLNPQ